MKWWFQLTEFPEQTGYPRSNDYFNMPTGKGMWPGFSIMQQVKHIHIDKPPVHLDSCKFRHFENAIRCCLAFQMKWIEAKSFIPVWIFQINRSFDKWHFIASLRMKVMRQLLKYFELYMRRWFIRTLQNFDVLTSAWVGWTQMEAVVLIKKKLNSKVEYAVLIKWFDFIGELFKFMLGVRKFHLYYSAEFNFRFS